MKKFIKMSLMAAVAVAGLTTTASAGGLGTVTDGMVTVKDKTVMALTDRNAEVALQIGVADADGVDSSTSVKLRVTADCSLVQDTRVTASVEKHTDGYEVAVEGRKVIFKDNGIDLVGSVKIAQVKEELGHAPNLESTNALVGVGAVLPVGNVAKVESGIRFGVSSESYVDSIVEPYFAMSGEVSNGYRIGTEVNFRTFNGDNGGDLDTANIGFFVAKSF